MVKLPSAAVTAKNGVVGDVDEGVHPGMIVAAHGQHQLGRLN